MNDAIFTTRGRLTRRDYALTIAVLCGGISLCSFAAISALLPLTYLTATAFFREESAAFWTLLIMGLAGLFTLSAILLPLLAIPATVRRLHDIGCGGWLAFPLILASLVALGLPVLFFSFFAALFEGMNRIPDLTMFDSPDEMGFIFGMLVSLYVALCLISFFILSFYGAWIFLKKGAPAANRYGELPVEEAIPSVRAAFLSSTGTIARRPFVLRTLTVLAAAGIIVPTVGQSVLSPFAAILKSLGLAPIGSDFFALIIGGTIYPLAALPLVLRRLRSIGRSSWEAVMVFAMLLPNLISTAEISRFLGSLDMLEEDDIGAAVIEEFLSIGTTDDTAFITLWVLCAVLSFVGAMRLLRADTSAG